MEIRPLGAPDASAFQALRLLGLQESPSAFGSSLEEEQGRTQGEVRAHLTASDHQVFFGCFEASTLVGIIGVGRERRLKEHHVAYVRSLYVAPAARGSRIATSLLETALRHADAWPEVEQVTLAVTAGNEAALRLYHGLGFTEVGRMPRALRLGNDYFDELQMVRFRPSSPSSPRRPE